MNYCSFGMSKKKVSILGFGCMRFPIINVNGKKMVDEDKTIKVLKSAYDVGVNYFDTAYFYCDGMSERVLGKAVKDIRNEIYISTKCHESYVKKPGDLSRVMEQQLEKLDTGYIDFYHLHGLRFEKFLDTEKRANWVKELMDAKSQGLIRHISFSVHDKPENIIKLIDLGIFETMLCQYNLIERQNESVIKYAALKGLGVAVMGPLGGGRISEFPDALPAVVKNNVEAAFRFVFSNTDVNIVLSGMENEAMLEENVRIASDIRPLKQDELERINELMEHKKRLSDLYCTGCEYCMPCSSGVSIPRIFKLANYCSVYNLEKYARKLYMELGKGVYSDEKRADSCTGCGVCEKKCPQGIKIRRQLEESHKKLSTGW